MIPPKHNPNKKQLNQNTTQTNHNSNKTQHKQNTTQTKHNSNNPNSNKTQPKETQQPAVTEVSRTARTRDDGTQYFEVEYSDGSMEDINA